MARPRCLGVRAVDLARNTGFVAVDADFKVAESDGDPRRPGAKRQQSARDVLAGIGGVKAVCGVDDRTPVPEVSREGCGMDAAFMDACLVAYLNGQDPSDPLVSPASPPARPDGPGSRRTA